MQKKPDTPLIREFEFLLTVFEYLPVAVFWKDVESRYLGCNGRFLDIEGLESFDQLVGKTDFEMPWKDYAEDYRNSDLRILNNNKAELGYEEYRLRPDGSKIWFRTSKIPLLDDKGKPNGILGCFLDISEQKSAEDELKQSEYRYRSLIEATDTGYMVLDSHGCVMDANSEYIRLSGHRSVSEILGRTPLEWTAEHDSQRHIDAIGDLLSSEGLLKGFEVDYCYPNGSGHPVELNAAAVETDQGKQILGLCRDISERYQVMQDLHNKDKFLENVLDDMLSYVGILEPDGKIIFTNNTPLRASGMELADVQGLCFYDGPWWSYSAEVRDTIKGDIEKCASGKSVTRKIKARMGKRGCRWVSFSAHPVRDENGDVIRLIVEGRDIDDDIAEVKEVQQRLFAETELLRTTLDSIGDGVITTDSRYRIQHINPVAERLTGWTLSEAKGKAIDHVFPVMDENSGMSFAYPTSKAIKQIKTIRHSEGIVLVDRHGQKFDIQLSVSAILNQQSLLLGAVIAFSDISETCRLTKELAFRASHDPLTELVNRYEFEKRLQRALHGAQQQGFHHALCYMDLDRFKAVNDNCGHLAGDELLRQISRLLQRGVRSRDTLARLGGDEFGLLIEHCTAKQAYRVAESIRKRVSGFRFSWDSKVLKVGISIGLVSVTERDRSTADILRSADVACYTAKRSGRNQVEYRASK